MKKWIVSIKRNKKNKHLKTHSKKNQQTYKKNSQYI